MNLREKFSYMWQRWFKFLDNPKEGEALQYLFEISKSIGADLSVLNLII